MKFSVEFVFRMIGMVVFAFLGWSFGGWAARIPPFDPMQELLYRVVFGLVGALAGLVLTPYFTTRPVTCDTEPARSSLGGNTVCRAGRADRRPADRRPALLPLFPTPAAVRSGPAFYRRAGFLLFWRFPVRHAPG